MVHQLEQLLVYVESVFVTATNMVFTTVIVNVYFPSLIAMVVGTSLVTVTLMVIIFTCLLLQIPIAIYLFAFFPT